MNNKISMIVILLSLNACFVKGSSGKDENLFTLDLMNSLSRPQISVSSNPDLGKPISTTKITFTFSEPILKKGMKEKIKLKSEDGNNFSAFTLAQIDDSKIEMNLGSETVPGSYTIDFSELNWEVGKPISPLSQIILYDPNAPTVSGVYGEILDSSLFSSGYLDISFSESVTGAEVLDHYSLDGSAMGSLRLSSVFRIKSNLYRLFYTGLPATSGGLLNVNIRKVYDEASNAIGASGLQFKVYGFKFAGNLINARYRSSMVMLNSGEILVTGGETSGGVSNTAEIYNPNTKLSRAVGNMITARQRHTTTLLNDGRVYVAGGDKTTSLAATDSINASEIFDPVTETFSAGPVLTKPRMDHSAIILESGKVLIAGGYEVENSSPFISLSNFDIYDSVSNTISYSGNMNYERRDFVLKRLSDDNIYVFGGRKKLFPPDDYTLQAEKFNETNNTFSLHPSFDINYPRSNFFIQEISSNQLLAYGDTLSTELYDSAFGSFQVSASLTRPRLNFGTVKFSDGKIILFGGEYDGSYVPKIDYYDPSVKRFIIGNRMLYPRIGVTPFLLSSGKVVLLGGKAAGLVAEIEEYSYE
jgi:hypothetical protein